MNLEHFDSARLADLILMSLHPQHYDYRLLHPAFYMDQTQAGLHA